jgi:para-nitrobenzyl esterase
VNRRHFLQTLGGASALGSGGIGSTNAWWFDPEVDTESGTVEGESKGDTDVFRGIPFAKQPVGERRWRPPETPAPSWDGTLDATSYGPRAPQPSLITSAASLVGIDLTTAVGDEDGCLNLNIWAPSGASPDNPKPVMVWIYGGAYDIGDNRYNGRQLSERGDVVIVTINYRLGPLGFFTHPDLLAEDERNVNQGYQDMIAGLEWVQRNIRAFGGDPDNVTIFGESAGGQSVLTLLTDPKTEGLFDRVICESGPIVAQLQNREQAAQDGVDLAEQIGCSGPDAASCLRSAPVEDLLQNTGGLFDLLSGDDIVGRLEGTIGLVVDGEVIEKHPAKRVRDGEFHDVPVLTGGNADEMQFFLANTDVSSEQRARELLSASLEPDQVEAVLEQYPFEAYETPKDTAIDAATDGLFLCNDRLTAKWLSENGATVYRYVFGDAPSDPLELIQVVLGERRAYHGAELAYVWGDGDNITQQGLELSDTGLVDKKLARTMQDYWTNFAANGDPNAEGWFAPPEWPTFDADEQRQVRLLEDDVRQESGTKPECEVWEPILKERIGVA